eukprot:scaffold3346_cov106-Isochrysis_galbana.AAC.3
MRPPKTCDATPPERHMTLRLRRAPHPQGRVTTSDCRRAHRRLTAWQHRGPQQLNAGKPGRQLQRTAKRGLHYGASAHSKSSKSSFSSGAGGAAAAAGGVAAGAATRINARASSSESGESSASTCEILPAESSASAASAAQNASREGVAPAAAAAASGSQSFLIASRSSLYCPGSSSCTQARRSSRKQRKALAAGASSGRAACASSESVTASICLMASSVRSLDLSPSTCQNVSTGRPESTCRAGAPLWAPVGSSDGSDWTVSAPASGPRCRVAAGAVESPAGSFHMRLAECLSIGPTGHASARAVSACCAALKSPVSGCRWRMSDHGGGGGGCSGCSIFCFSSSK